MTDCFVHASDLHLDARLGGLGRLDEESRERLAGEARQAWSDLVRTTIDLMASFLVIAGDIFHQEVAQPLAQRDFLEGLRRLDDAGISVLVCHGNHDPLTDGFEWIGKLPGNVTIFPSGSPTTEKVRLNSGASVYVSGLSFAETSETGNLAARFRDITRPAGPHVAVLHANLNGDPAHDLYAPCTLDDLRAAPVDYWALGHIHLRAVHALGPGRSGAYCGNLQGRSFKPAECHPKGALVVPIENGQIGSPEFVECDRVRFVHEEVPVKPDDEIEDVLVKIEQVSRDQGAMAQGRPVVLSLILTGRHPEPGSIRSIIQVENDLLEQLPGLLNDGGLARVESRVASHRTREELIESGGFRAHVLRSLDAEVIQEELKRLVSELPVSVVSGLRADGDSDDDPKTVASALSDEIVSMAEELLLSNLDGHDA